MNSPTLRKIRIFCAIVFVCGIAGMIITSIAGNNVGWVNTIGVTTAVTALVLVIATVSSTTNRIDVFDEADAERLERRIVRLIKSGTDETELREIVRDSRQIGRHP
ncbi:hypothetical protein LBMAG16_05090 [Actinomycetes bacterium]|nr:hypothetical protein LBMAG16_05090 [Actinomycetes bacterium]